jgi:GTPase SAR1 family protein
MFSLIRGFYHRYFDKPVFKVLFVGIDGAGKTTLLE